MYEKIHKERKELQAAGRLPPWMITASWQLLKEKYVTPEYPDHRSICERISKHLAQYTHGMDNYWEPKFFEIIWNNWFVPSTPVMANCGRGFGAPVSCSGNDIDDRVGDFYEKQKENAILSQKGYGTSSYLGNIRPRGAHITGVKGGASGVVPVFKDFVQMSKDISQGSQRRGAWSGYLEVDHKDVKELMIHVGANPDDANPGWNITDAFVAKLDSGDEEALEMYQKSLKLKMVSGKGYYHFVDKVNRANPPMYKDRGVKVKASNLCTEISLFSGTDYTTGKEYTFSCVLGSMNAATYDEWKDTDAIRTATVFLDCVNQDQIEIVRGIPELYRVYNFANDTRALGLGLLGFHTYLQEKMIPFGSLDAHFFNLEIFKLLNDESKRASEWMAKEWGEPEWCKGYGVRNTHRMAVAPNLSSALFAGGLSQGIEPIYKNAYVQASAGGKVVRASPKLRSIMKERGVDITEATKRIIRNKGSVREEDYLTDDEKLVFLTAFEINQKDILRLASARQPFIDQAQSINLFFSSEEDEEYISEIHKIAFLDENIKSLYYIRSENGVSTSKECLACAN
jgi:ribonucleoside-diphosphate reductase alpha chain